MRSSIAVRTLTLVTVLAASLGLSQAPANAAPASSSSSTPVPSDQRCGVINFEKATVSTGTGTVVPRRTLVVTGEVPMPPVSVTLEPLVYIAQPDYWGIEVVGCFPEIGLPVMTRFTVKLDVTNTIGKSGIEVIGATKSQKIPVS